MKTLADGDRVSLPIEVLVRAVRALQRAARYDDARALLDAAVDDERLAVVRADLAVASSYVIGAGPEVEAAITAARAAVAAGGRLADDVGAQWDVDFLDVRHDYMTQIFEPATQLASPVGRDLARVDALRDRVVALRDSAPDDGHRGWASFYLGTVYDNLYGAREVCARAPRGGPVCGCRGR